MYLIHNLYQKASHDALRFSINETGLVVGTMAGRMYVSESGEK